MIFFLNLSIFSSCSRHSFCLAEKFLQQPVRPIYFSGIFLPGNPRQHGEIRRRKVSTAMKGQTIVDSKGNLSSNQFEEVTVLTVPVLRLSGCNRFRSGLRRHDGWRRNPLVETTVHQQISFNEPVQKFKQGKIDYVKW
ncbi:uncharacterized protein LOC129752052 [Uranotaenia lowii]|uniref:uncharacterized protein LOC129752052 n=1 Tax=Uranotaenia lowii TaxID=190385 RepID=UPI00247ABC64|nr:uncharacterized protein LOC129752052 [Uranotaenia lowii]